LRCQSASILTFMTRVENRDSPSCMAIHIMDRQLVKTIWRTLIGSGILPVPRRDVCPYLGVMYVDCLAGSLVGRGPAASAHVIPGSQGAAPWHRMPLLLTVNNRQTQSTWRTNQKASRLHNYTANRAPVKFSNSSKRKTR